MVRSRLSRRLEQKTKKNLVLSILGIVLIILLIFKFGIPFLANLSLFLSGSRTNQEQFQNQNPIFIAPPILNSLPQATASANIIISGFSAKNQTISLYINGNPVDETKTKDDGSFSFKKAISTGENIIKTKAIENDKESDYSQSLTIILKKAPPFLNISSPSDNQSFSKDQNSANIKGTTDTDVKVTVNGFWAITDDNGNFSYSLPLQNGENKIKITATDLAGNKNEKELKVTYSP
ncbi:MAG: hypothetical protein A3B47_02015 [Candidatus Levybacteria bacterium RIFCSPLOWO2_01_FULL_39_24]|nr:MAG: hypothetical protein A2800_01310 [Candidatus Levybacteria bacterium RIFCSPHIGHO2_01_FULL_40_16]OGH27767.1 MAG: hypothetical protein A3E12_00280 [Candidatus Levybacteria bacterium RIFCSPHIGHO2_12_FULL_39_9]OGH46417.1 MAG: hypothetical protein A3B47_02015 [Candidatus Levybacteria bacterium RIFCSPLOWO2_01_FULL_39_24]